MEKYEIKPIGDQYCVVDEKDNVVTSLLMPQPEAKQIADDMNEIELSIAMAKTFISETN